MQTVDFTHLQDADTDRVSREMQRRWELEEQPLTKAEWDAFCSEVDRVYGVEPQQQEEVVHFKDATFYPTASAARRAFRR